MSALRARLGTVNISVVRRLISGVGWNVGAVAVERLVGMVQAFYVARLLGIEDFGKYGLLFVTVGLMSSILGLQLGLTSSVNIARNRETDPAQSAAVMRLCEMFSLGLSASALIVIGLYPAAAAKYLLGDASNVSIIFTAGIIAAVAVVAGVQEGILQGLEQFRGLAYLRAGFSLIGLGLLFAISKQGDLASVILALMLGAILRLVSLIVWKEQQARGRGLHTNWQAVWRARNLIFSFSLPAVAATMVNGSANWFGFYLVSLYPGGFREVAALTAGQQWRGVVLYVATISASVAIPMMSRLAGTGDDRGIKQVHRVSLFFSVGAAVAFVAGICLFADRALMLYGSRFTEGKLPFIAMVATTAPVVWINVYFQYLVSQGRMWEQFGYYLAQAFVLMVGYLLLVKPYGAAGIALWTLATGIVLCIVVTKRVRFGKSAPRL